MTTGEQRIDIIFAENDFKKNRVVERTDDAEFLMRGAQIYDKNGTEVWHGDINMLHDAATLKKIARVSKSDLYVVDSVMSEDVSRQPMDVLKYARYVVSSKNSYN